MFLTEKLLVFYDKFNSRGMLKDFSELKKEAGADAWAIKRYQNKALKSILGYALDRSPYYKKNLSKIDLRIKTGEIVNFDFVPLLYKSTIKKHLNELISSEYADSKKIYFDYTGGSSGQPLKFAYDKGYKDFRWATIYFNLYQVGYRFGDCHGFVYGSHYDSQKQYSLRQRLQFIMMNSFSINAFFLTDKDISLFVKKIIRKQPKFLIGYASALLEVAKYVKKNKFEIKLNFIESTAEYLSAENRGFIEDVFDCDVYDRYGCREIGNIAHECGFKNGMHINWQSVFVEIVNKGAYPWLGADYGDVLVTSLRNKGMPLIRYFLGDIGKIDDSPCKCGLHSSRIILGGCREGDLLVSKDGGVVSSPALTLVYKDLEGIEKIQFVQPDPGRLVVNIVRDGNFFDKEAEIIRRLDKVFGEKMDININFVKAIEREESGKYRITNRLFPLNENTISQ